MKNHIIKLEHLNKSNGYYNELGSVLMADSFDSDRLAGMWIHNGQLLPVTPYGSYTVGYIPVVGTDRDGLHVYGWDTYDDSFMHLCPTCGEDWLRTVAEPDHFLEVELLEGYEEGVECGHCDRMIAEAVA